MLKQKLFPGKIDVHQKYSLIRVRGLFLSSKKIGRSHSQTIRTKKKKTKMTYQCNYIKINVKLYE
jgi:hypothetical protein